MKIGNPTDNAAAAAVTNGTPAANGQPRTGSTDAAAKSGVDASAKIELSNTASTLLSGGATAEFDAEKVARISQAINDGTFKINPEAIADKMLSNAQELLSKVKS